MKKQLLIALTGIALFTSGCASISSPEGGERDLVAPKLVSSSPKNGQINVKPESIVLTFDEAVQTVDLNRQLLIAPFTDNTYKTKVKDKTVEITFTDPWLENTTYSLNFRKGIADITEKNAAKDLVLTFSTGNFLDSGRVAGNVGFLFSNTPPKEASVLLYPASDTAQIAKGRPLYVGQTDSLGKFIINNVKLGYYHIYALTETNNNLRYDNESENIAYLPDSILINPSIDSIQLKLHKQDTTKPNVLSRKGYSNLYEIAYNEGLANATVKDLNGTSEEIRWLLESSGKTLRLFPASQEEKKWIIEVRDSANNQRLDTVGIRLSGTPASRRIKSFMVTNGNSVKPGEELKLAVEVPAKIIDPQGAITLILDSATTITTKEAKDLELNPTGTEITLKLPYSAKEEIRITMDTTKIMPFVGEPFAQDTASIEVTEKTTTGSLKVKLATDHKNYFIQLMQQGKIMQEVKNQSTILWEDLEPGTYTLRILVDSNGNGKWDNGSLKDRILPEPVILPADIFEIRSNWEIETSLIEF